MLEGGRGEGGGKDSGKTTRGHRQWKCRHEYSTLRAFPSCSLVPAGALQKGKDGPGEHELLTHTPSFDKNSGQGRRGSFGCRAVWREEEEWRRGRWGAGGGVMDGVATVSFLLMRAQELPTEILSLHSRPARVSTTQLCPSLKIIFSAVVCLIISSSSSPLSILLNPRPPRGHDDRGCPAALASRITRQLARGCQSAADVARCGASLYACAADCIMICTSTSLGSAVSSSIVLRASLCVRIHTNQLPPECFV